MDTFSNLSWTDQYILLNTLNEILRYDIAGNAPQKAVHKQNLLTLQERLEILDSDLRQIIREFF